MRSWFGMTVRRSLVITLCILSAAEIGCTDVGDNSAGAGADGSGSESANADSSLEPDSTTGDAGSAGTDGTLGEDGAATEQDAETDSMGTLADAAPESAPITVPDAQTESGAPESGAPEAGAPESGAPESGAPEAGLEAGSPDAGEHDAGAVDGANGSGGEGGSTQGLVPCTTTGQTNCVNCDQNTNNLCTATEAILVTRDIEKGFVSGTTLTMDSCYECGITYGVVDSTLMNLSGNECDDLSGAAVQQQCLDAVNCYLGFPQSGTAGLNGTNSGATPADLAADCSNEKPSGVFNCFCGTNEPNVTVCKTAGTVAAAATGGPGVASPNGVCINQIIAGTGATPSTPNATIITDMSTVTLGAGRASQLVQNLGSNQDPAPCPQCFQ